METKKLNEAIALFGKIYGLTPAEANLPVINEWRDCFVYTPSMREYEAFVVEQTYMTKSFSWILAAMVVVAMFAFAGMYGMVLTGSLLCILFIIPAVIFLVYCLYSYFKYSKYTKIYKKGGLLIIKKSSDKDKQL